MKNFKKIILGLVAVAAVGTLAACSSAGASKSSNTWDQAKKTKKITIGFDNTFVPMGFKDKDGKNKGFDIDLANAVFAKSDIKVKWQPINWNMKESELQQKKIDLIWNGYSITAARQKKVLFTNSYMTNKQILLVKKDSGINSTEDMKGKTLGAQSGSSGYELFNDSPSILKDKISGTISQYSTFDEGFLDLKNGRINGLLVDEPFAEYYLKENKETADYKVIPTAYKGEGFAVGARKSDTELVKQINKGFKELRADGEFQKISQKWFNKDVWPGK